ncbi:MAG: hypothetical protein QOJ42_4857 [Acidobacteriaceae bacterium]|nr:hypothetical protein [Acidobacteriaceae bacterium]
MALHITFQRTYEQKLENKVLSSRRLHREPFLAVASITMDHPPTGVPATAVPTHRGSGLGSGSTQALSFFLTLYFKSSISTIEKSGNHYAKFGDQV